MPTDPRQRKTRAAAAAAAAAESNEQEEINETKEEDDKQTPNIFLSNDDVMEEEEEDEEIDLPVGQASAAAHHQQQYPQQQLSSGGAMPGTSVLGVSGISSYSSSAITNEETKLLSKIIVPSPFIQHNAEEGGSSVASSRFRNSLNRVTTSPTTDAEAWQALMTEVNSCYRSLQSVHAVDAETHAKLDWIESCYGALLSNFPYAASYYCQILDILMAQSARVGEEHGPLIDYGRGLSQRAILCEAKVEAVLRTVLGVNMDGSSVVEQGTDINNEGTDGMDVDDDENKDATNIGNGKKDSSIGGMCIWSVELWLIYVRKVIRDAYRSAKTIIDPDDRATYIRETTEKAYETALSYASFCHNNHLLWKQYLTWVKSWVSPSSNQGGGGDDDNNNSQSASEHALQQKQMIQLRSVYQRLACLPMTGLDQLWQEYEQFEKNQSEALAQALISEFQPKYQHARTVYLERQRVYGGMMAQSELQYDRLAVEPVYQSDDEDEDAETTDEEYATKRQEEFKLLQVWKVRCSYERSNPERLSSRDLATRIRTAYKELTSVWTRHPECWHMWSSWELLHSESLITEDDKVNRARATLQMGQRHVPDCTFLAYAEAQIIEHYHDEDTDAKSKASECIAVMENFLRRSPNTLGFVLCQQMVRRYNGIDDARAVFARARRILSNFGSNDDADNAIISNKEDGNKVGGAAIETSDGLTGKGEKTGTTASTNTGGHQHDDGNKKRWMVTNRLDASIKGEISSAARASATITDSSTVTSGTVMAAGPITWHLFASHAMIEHRLNKLPEVAARVYELGLRKHSSFITKPPYVARYAQLLLELGDAMNLRALLTRAVGACEQLQEHQKLPQQQQQSRHQQQKIQQLQSALASFWDMTLRFESLLSSEDHASSDRLREIERKRRQAVMGPDVEDLATGGSLATSEVPLIGAQKATISEQLARSEGYDIGSNIVSGMNRTVDFLEVIGLLGNDLSLSSSTTSLLSRRRPNQEYSSADSSGGKSDASYHMRLQYQNLVAAGLSTESAAAGEGHAGAAGTKVLSARERLQQGAAAGAGGGAGGQGQPTAMMLRIQQSPEWLRPLLQLLPASRLRLPIVAKPPPHLTELALSSLKQNQLPSERPADSTTNGSKARSKRRMADTGDDSSDDEENGVKAGGYGNQFRNRKRTRMMQNGSAD